MNNRQQILEWHEVQALPCDSTAVWTSARFLTALQSALPGFFFVCEPPRVGISNVIVVGGGKRIDAAKIWRNAKSPQTWICAVPTLWGSGAEASCVAVSTQNGLKVATLSPSMLPDARSLLPSLAKTIPAELALWGMGDAWSHLLEAFLSPLSSPEVRQQCADLLKDGFLPAGLTPHLQWFELSAQASSLQAQAGVGLVHAIAHTLEPQLSGFGHARLCSLFLLPVFRYNRSRGDKVTDQCATFGIDPDLVDTVIQGLFHSEDYEALLPALAKHWAEVIRHPLARINCTLVRPDSLAWFESEAFA